MLKLCIDMLLLDEIQASTGTIFLGDRIYDLLSDLGFEKTKSRSVDGLTQWKTEHKMYSFLEFDTVKDLLKAFPEMDLRTREMVI